MEKFIRTTFFLIFGFLGIVFISYGIILLTLDAMKQQMEMYFGNFFVPDTPWWISVGLIVTGAILLLMVIKIWPEEKKFQNRYKTDQFSDPHLYKGKSVVKSLGPSAITKS
jgi:hypothetical protein